MPRHDESRLGPIDGLNLPPNAWHVLRRENIRTVRQLRAIADRIERLDGVGCKTALAIREELARIASVEGQLADEGWSPGPWIA